MPKRRHLLPMFAVLVFITSIALAGIAGANTKNRSIASRRVSFSVVNSNTSGLPCPSDGKRYVVRGSITGPREAFAGRGRTITVLLHGFSTGTFQWTFLDLPGYSHVREMAKLGDVSLSIDRLGYDSSDHPQGFVTCYGAAADIAHQIVQQLRTAAYSMERQKALRFSKVILAGHDTGGYIAEIEAFSYKDVDGLAVMSWAEQGYSDDVGQKYYPETVAECARGGREAESGEPGGYVRYPSIENEEAASFGFFDAPAELRRAFFKHRNRNPCGDLLSLAQGMFIVNPARLGEIEVPVLLIFGERDFVWKPEAKEEQEKHFTGTKDLISIELKRAGHFFMFDGVAREFRRLLGSWVGARFS